MADRDTTAWFEVHLHASMTPLPGSGLPAKSGAHDPKARPVAECPGPSATRRQAAMEEISTGDAGNVIPFDRFEWPLCATLGREGTSWLAPDIPQSVLVAVLTSYLDLAEDEVLLAITSSAAK